MGIAEVAIIIVLILSFMFRNLVQGHVAGWLGDPTARLSGRLSANPITHLDLFGSIIVPGILLLSGTGILIGWPKPIPYNPYNFRNQRWGEAIVSLSGPVASFALALIFMLIVRFAPGLEDSFVNLSVDIIVLNLFLAFFNLIPIPPLDGAKILPALLPYNLAHKYQKIVALTQQNPLLSLLFVFLIFFFFLGGPVFGLVLYIGTLFSGLSFAEFMSYIR